MDEQIRLPLASIVINNINLGNNKYLEKALNSCLSQDYVNKNIVVVSNDDSDNLVQERLTEVIKDKDDDATLILKGKIDNINVALIKLKQSSTQDQLRGIGVKAVANIAHIYALLDSDSYYYKDSILSEAVVEFIQFPSTVGIVFTNNINHNEKLDVDEYHIKRPGTNFFISKPAMELVNTATFSDILSIVEQKFIISYLPTIGIVKHTNITLPKRNTQFKQQFDEIKARVKNKQMNDQT